MSLSANALRKVQEIRGKKREQVKRVKTSMIISAPGLFRRSSRFVSQKFVLLRGIIICFLIIVFWPFFIKTPRNLSDYQPPIFLPKIEQQVAICDVSDGEIIERLQTDGKVAFLPKAQESISKQKKPLKKKVQDRLIIPFLLYLNNSVLASGIYESTAQDQKSLEVIVYDQGIALIKNIRRVHLPLGLCTVHFKDIAEKINPKTVYIRPLFKPQSFSVLEQHYVYDKITSEYLLDKYIGKKIKICIKNPNTKKEETLEAILLNKNVYKIGDEIYIGKPNKVVLPEFPQDLIFRPTLTWLLESKEEEHLIEVSYVTSGIGWSADYVLVLNRNEEGGDFRGWATIDNQSGVDYNNAKVRLIAKEGFKESEKRHNSQIMARSQEKKSFEYHDYKLQRITTIKDGQKKQINFLQKNITPTEQLVYCGDSSYYRSYYDTTISHEKIQAYLDIENNLDMVLPRGKVEIYQEDKEGELRLVGEDKIGHIPKDKKIRLNLGMAFDVVFSRKQTVYKRLTPSLSEIGWKLFIENHRQKPVNVIIKEPIEGDWEMITTSFPYQKISANTLQFVLDVPANGQKSFDYQVKIRYE